jgi:hypothetical protein
MTTVWEYWNGSAWVTLTPLLDETTILQQTGTGVKKLRFLPPATWASTTVNSVAGYFIRCRISAFTSIVTVPLGTRVYLLNFTGGTGLPLWATCNVTGANWKAKTISAANNDTLLFLVNWTAGTYVVLTLTKALALGTAAATLAFTAADQLGLVQIQQDGSTEYADVQLWLSLGIT